MKRIFITGITGTIGQEVLKQLLAMDEDFAIQGLTRDEVKLKKMRRDFPGVKMTLGNISQKFMNYNDPEIDILFHFAALKHVDLLEEFYWDSIETNLEYLDNILMNSGQARIVFTSTDKAAYPINVYGLCKSLSEKILLKEHSDNVICRYGNVLASNGSVIHLFKEKIENGEPVPITHKDMTRFWISIKDAAGFVIKSALGRRGGLKIPAMKGYGVEALARLIAEYLGRPIEIEYVGLRPGEKIHECLATKYDAGHERDIYSDSISYSKAEMLELIREVI